MPETPAAELEAALRQRYETRTERFSHGALQLELLLPRAADALIDEADFARDERLPYWAELWPSARALARRLADAPLPTGRVLELGCGLALPSLALLWRGHAALLATDYYAEALGFARANAARNGLPPLPTALLDWRDPDPALGRFPTLLAADVLYEQRNVEVLAALLERLLAPGGTLWLADPGRIYLASFRERMAAAGWAVAEERVAEPAAEAPRGQVEIRLLRLSAPRRSGTPR